MVSGQSGGRSPSLTVLPDLLCLGPEGDVGLLQVEQRPGLGPEVGPVEAGQRCVVAMETHGAAELHGVFGERRLEERNVAAGDDLQHAGPVAVMGGVHVCWETGDYPNLTICANLLLLA